MTRKAKIAWVVGGIALAATAICFFSSGEEGEVTAIYAGLASNDSRYVSFTISNSFDDEMYCDYETRELRDGEWQPPIGETTHTMGYLPTRCVTNLTVLVPSTNRWKVEVSCTKPWPDNMFYNTRRNLIYFAIEHGWSLLEKLLLLGYTWEFRYGPEMLGNKPVAEDQK